MAAPEVNLTGPVRSFLGSEQQKVASALAEIRTSREYGAGQYQWAANLDSVTVTDKRSVQIDLGDNGTSFNYEYSKAELRDLAGAEALAGWNKQSNSELFELLQASLNGLQEKAEKIYQPLYEQQQGLLENGQNLSDINPVALNAMNSANTSRQFSADALEVMAAQQTDHDRKVTDTKEASPDDLREVLKERGNVNADSLSTEQLEEYRSTLIARLEQEHRQQLLATADEFRQASGHFDLATAQDKHANLINNEGARDPQAEAAGALVEAVRADMTAGQMPIADLVRGAADHGEKFEEAIKDRAVMREASLEAFIDDFKADIKEAFAAGAAVDTAAAGKGPDSGGLDQAAKTAYTQHDQGRLMKALDERAETLGPQFQNLDNAMKSALTGEQYYAARADMLEHALEYSGPNHGFAADFLHQKMPELAPVSVADLVREHGHNPHDVTHIAVDRNRDGEVMLRLAGANQTNITVTDRATIDRMLTNGLDLDGTRSNMQVIAYEESGVGTTDQLNLWNTTGKNLDVRGSSHSAGSFGEQRIAEANAGLAINFVDGDKRNEDKLMEHSVRQMALGEHEEASSARRAAVRDTHRLERREAMDYALGQGLSGADAMRFANALQERKAEDLIAGAASGRINLPNSSEPSLEERMRTAMEQAKGVRERGLQLSYQDLGDRATRPEEGGPDRTPAEAALAAAEARLSAGGPALT